MEPSTQFSRFTFNLQHLSKSMYAARPIPLSFPGEKAIQKGMLEKLLSKRSYVDSSSNVLVLLQGGKAPTSAVHVPEKYSKIIQIISYRYILSESHEFLVLTTPWSYVSRYEVYRHATAAIQGAKTSADTTSATQKLARVLHYLDDVRNAYIARARLGDVSEETWFSPELEYHLWLDYSEGAYHNTACASIEKTLGVTFKYVLEQKQPDILTFSKSSGQTSEFPPLMIFI